MKILDKLERLKEEYDKSFDKLQMLDAEHYWEELSVLTYTTLPALIRVARAAEELHTSIHGWGRTNSELAKALQQLREVGE